MTKTKREIWKKEKGQKEERTHYSSVEREMITHDIRVMGHDTPKQSHPGHKHRLSKEDVEDQWAHQ